MIRLATPYRNRGSVTNAPARPDSIKPKGVGSAPGHKADLLTLLSAGDANTGDLAAVLEMSAPYVGTLLVELELEGRIESRKVGARKVWSLP